MKKSLKIVWSLLAVFFVLFCGYVFAICYGLSSSLKPISSEKSPAAENWVYKEEEDKLLSYRVEIKKTQAAEELKAFPRLKEICQVVETESFDGLKLKAFFGKTDSHNYLIFMHGYTDSPKMSSVYAMHYADMGWNILVPGQRGHGFSEGAFIDMGAFARFDVLSWIKFIEEQDKDARIILHGISMGSATVLMSCGLDLGEHVAGCIGDCGYTSVYDEFTYRLKKMHLAEIPSMMISRIFAKIHYGYDMKETSSIEAVKKSSVPILLIHGDADDYVPYFMMQQIYDSAKKAGVDVKKQTIPDADHACSVILNPQLYWNTVDAFVNDCLSR